MESGSTIRVGSPIGPLTLYLEGAALCRIDLAAAGERVVPGPPSHPAIGQLRAYFEDPRFRFSLPLKLRGTPFQLRVWQALRAIPPGEVRTYGILARRLETSARAIGAACRANPCPIVVPCHRVVAAQGLGGYGGDIRGGRTAIKRWLLHHEGLQLPA